MSKLSNVNSAFLEFGLIHRMYDAVVTPRTFISSVNCSRNVKLTVALAKPRTEPVGRRSDGADVDENRLF